MGFCTGGSPALLLHYTFYFETPQGVISLEGLTFRRGYGLGCSLFDNYLRVSLRKEYTERLFLKASFKVTSDEFK